MGISSRALLIPFSESVAAERVFSTMSEDYVQGHLDLAWAADGFVRNA